MAFDRGSHLLHTSCAEGEVDQRLHERMRITALHIAPESHASYQQNNPAASLVNQLWGLAATEPGTPFLDPLTPLAVELLPE